MHSITLHLSIAHLLCSAPDVDHEVRWCLLKLADLLLRPVEEMPPSVKIHIPSTPVTEVNPQIPLVKVPVKPSRAIKSGGPPPRHPSIQLNVSAAKTKLPNSPRPPLVEPPVPSPAIKKAIVFAQPAPPAPPPKTVPVAKQKTKAVTKPQVGKANNRPITKPTQVPKAQSAGMSINDLRACRNALKKLQSNKHAALFNHPVDPVRDNAPRYDQCSICLRDLFNSFLSARYLDIIKEPMDLSTMGAKLEAGKYKDRFTFQADFRLMISNAKLYNTAGSYVHNEAIALEIFFEKRRCR